MNNNYNYNFNPNPSFMRSPASFMPNMVNSAPVRMIPQATSTIPRISSLLGGAKVGTAGAAASGASKITFSGTANIISTGAGATFKRSGSSSDVYDILKVNGLFLFTYQIGQGEDMADEPYLNEKGKNSLYMCYHTNEEINDLLHSFSYTELFRKQKMEISPSAINSNSVTTVFILAKKIK